MRELASPAVASPVAMLGMTASFAARGVASSASARDLAKVLAEELAVEEEGYAKPPEVASGPPAPFTLSEVPGDTLLSLTRTFQGEEISVDLHVNNQPAQDYGDENTNDDGEALSTVAFNTTVTKGGDALVFECESDGTYVSITHISHEPKQGNDSESIYTGPVFDELDETLQTEMRQYLQTRGITEELGEYLRHLIYDKEQREYMGWLKKVHAFVK